MPEFSQCKECKVKSQREEESSALSSLKNSTPYFCVCIGVCICVSAWHVFQCLWGSGFSKLLNSLSSLPSPPVSKKIFCIYCMQCVLKAAYIVEWLILIHLPFL